MSQSLFSAFKEIPDGSLLEESSPLTFFLQPANHFEELGLPSLLIEDLLFKLLINQGALSGRQIASEICIPFKLVEPFLADLKARLFLAHRSTSGIGDFIYTLTDSGRERGLRAREVSAYVGSAPVPFKSYLVGVEAQSIRNEKPNPTSLKNAFSDLIINHAMLSTLGPAVNSGRGLFLYGAPGNGKTSIAERIVDCFQDTIYIPKTLWIDGQLVQLFDPETHVVATDTEDTPAYDARWIRVRRPVVTVGGELTLDSLEIKYNELLRVSEAPLQMKANGGIFFIDDFGRQRIHPKDLLNRWIVPLEKRIDFLTLPNGKKIQVPFDELIIFSTNLEPEELVDEAFLRRIPYKVHVEDPTEADFRKLFKILSPRYNIEYDEDMLTYLIQTHYREKKRPFRACQPRDLLEQLYNMASFNQEQPRLSPSLLDLACNNYFAAMGKTQ